MMNRRPAWLREFERMTAALHAGRADRSRLSRLKKLEEFVLPPPRLEPDPAPRWLN